MLLEEAVQLMHKTWRIAKNNASIQFMCQELPTEYPRYNDVGSFERCGETRSGARLVPKCADSKSPSTSIP